MTYYDLLGIPPTNDLEKIVMAVMKLKFLNYHVMTRDDLERLNSIKHFFSKFSNEYYDYVTNPDSIYQVPGEDIYDLSDQFYKPEEFDGKKLYIVEMDSFTIQTPNKVCQVYEANPKNLNQFVIDKPQIYFDLDSLCAIGVSDCLVLIISGKTFLTEFRVLAHISPLQNMHIVHSQILAAITESYGPILSSDYFLFGGAGELPQLFTVDVPESVPLLNLESRLKGNAAENMHSVDDTMYILLGEHNIIIEQQELNEQQELMTYLYSQSYFSSELPVKIDDALDHYTPGVSG
ncbi:hypothetical protein Lqui_2170 [Legionella quinlivanii]|uniref:Uncharacterized protein n=1 Tax=Legionella quinlivanii TaxID=45073 RepID=A0A0W0XU36_9GAMM|nr:hypothetical protein [Legionella quinlivanii]KTD47906.1 hypothetical protein Lqui_2170 [Legionella quinlivanii]SEG36983.1 hypothetical protein SAMN02746093_02687 [Legionella quinlivanii DSM 21216]STY10100.1 Uncharacterised protein [Legionella quinlivanii]